jgi:hypothetical protein
MIGQGVARDQFKFTQTGLGERDMTAVQCRFQRYDPGGGGINVALVCRANFVRGSNLCSFAGAVNGGVQGECDNGLRCDLLTGLGRLERGKKSSSKTSCDMA